MSSICRVAGPVSFFADVATFQIVPPGPDDAAVAPEALLGGLQRRRAGVEGGADQRVDRGWLGHDKRQREPAKAGRRRLRGAKAQLVPRPNAAVEALGAGGIGHFEDDGGDGGQKFDGLSSDFLSLRHGAAPDVVSFPAFPVVKLSF